MPLLDVSDALEDVVLQSTFDVLRRPVSVLNTGKVSSSGVVRFTDVPGVVFPNKGPLQRSETAQEQNKNLVVITKFPLRGASVDSVGQNFQGDIIIWSNNNFLVGSEDLKDWSKYGAGYVRAECSLLDMQSAPPVLTALQGATPPPVVAVSVAGKLQLLVPTILSATSARMAVTLQPANMIVMRNGLPQFSPDDYTSSNDVSGNTVFTFNVPLQLGGPTPDTLAVYV